MVRDSRGHEPRDLKTLPQKGSPGIEYPVKALATCVKHAQFRREYRGPGFGNENWEKHH